MEKPINLAEITNVEQLESMAYRQIVLIEQTTNNLKALQARIVELQAEVTEPQ